MTRAKKGDLPIPTPLGLRELITPVDTSDFFAHYWEQRPLLVARQDTGYYASVFSLDDVDSVLGHLSRSRQSGRVSLVKEGNIVPIVPPFGGTEGVFDVTLVLRRFCEGATLLVEGVEQDSPSVTALCRNLQQSFGGRVAVNMYLTPSDARGFAAHFDCHDVIILQISGTKSWQICGSAVPLPRAGMVPSAPVDMVPRQEIKLRAGDFLYLPRGFVHAARTDDDHSLHLTVGLHTVKWFDVIGGALADVVEKDERFRHSVPVPMATGTSVSSLDTTRFRALLQALVEQASLGEALQRLGDKSAPPAMPRIRDLIEP